MFSANHRQNPRKLVSVGMLCLAVGLILLTFVAPHTQTAKNLVQGAGGFLLGMSIVFNLVAVRAAARRRRCRSSDNLSQSAKGPS